jgi:thioredoxin 1
MKYIYFSAPWCGPCKMLAPKMELVANSVLVEKINVDENLEIATQYGIRNVPTVILLSDDNVEIERFVGAKDTNFYLDKIKEYEK